MKKQFLLILALGAALVFTARPAAALDVTNRLTLSGRFGYNIEARFRGAGSFSAGAPATPPPRFTREGDRFNYDNGYVLRDGSGNEGGLTTYWGYDSGSQISGNGIQLSRTVSQSTAADPATDKPRGSEGAELVFSRQLGVTGNNRYGFEAAANYLNLSFKDRSHASATSTRTTDTYGFTPGTTPPTAPYQGSFSGPGFVISDTPSSSSTTTLLGDTVVGRRDFEADLWGFRLGPYFEMPLGTNCDLAVSAGLAAGILDGSGKWSDTATSLSVGSVTRSGHVSDVDVLWGGYCGMNLTYRFNEHWGAMGGLQFQSLTSYQNKFGGRRMVVDFGESIFVTFGLTCTW